MSTSSSHREAEHREPPLRKVTRELPNLRNPAVAEEYKRQRTVLLAASKDQREELDFWESAQSHKGWV